MRDVVKVWGQGQTKSTCIVIPRKMAVLLGIKVGSFVEIILEDKELRIRRI